jgi:hypothetical protein
MLAELNEVALGIDSVTNAIALKNPLPFAWEEFATVQGRNCPGRADAGNFKGQLDGCFAPLSQWTCNVDRGSNVIGYLQNDQLKLRRRKNHVIVPGFFDFNTQDGLIEPLNEREVLRIQNRTNMKPGCHWISRLQIVPAQRQGSAVKQA